jgi:hypothetical protein
MAESCCGCGNTAIHPFEGLVRGIMDGERYDGRGMPPSQALHGEGKGCDWSPLHRVMAEYCPRCGRPTRRLSREEA